ncbi:histidine phosphatase family protein [Rhodococcoides fascians]|uniref:histidine phosphatase family protein n=1 Tax=Rhodococcoides fascians TaxID=1828 RepID=UPI00353000D6
MTTRYVYLARHGDADAFGRLTDVGREQAGLLGERLGHIPLDVVWHSPLPRAVDTAHEIVRHRRSHTPVIESDELIDNPMCRHRTRHPRRGFRSSTAGTPTTH